MKMSNRRRLWLRRRKRVRKQLARSDAPLLSVYRSNKHIYAQIVDPLSGKTLTGASTRSPAVREGLGSTKDKDAAKKVGRVIAELAIAREIQKVSFNRNGFVYTGRLRALADAAREAGLKF
jgi:large subunit ribosomal protein L18